MPVSDHCKGISFDTCSLLPAFIFFLRRLIYQFAMYFKETTTVIYLHVCDMLSRVSFSYLGDMSGSPLSSRCHCRYEFIDQNTVIVKTTGIDFLFDGGCKVVCKCKPENLFLNCSL